jgi:hypothetical protein
LCIGLNHNELPLFSFNDEPWSRLPKTSVVRPQNSHLVKEVSRRAELYNISPVPQPSNWNRAKSMRWLEQNPVCGEADVEFLTNEVLRLRAVLERQITETVSTSGVSGSGRSWRGAIPYLRIIMCLTQDNVKHLFLTRANARTRQELDARNSDSR